MCFIEEHVNECLERGSNKLFLEDFIDTNSDSQSKQHSSNNHQTNSDDEKRTNNSRKPWCINQENSSINWKFQT